MLELEEKHANTINDLELEIKIKNRNIDEIQRKLFIKEDDFKRHDRLVIIIIVTILAFTRFLIFIINEIKLKLDYYKYRSSITIVREESR